MDKLKIFKDSYTLTNKIYAAMPEMTKLHRYSMGSMLLNSSLEMFKWISIVNNARGAERVAYMTDFFINLEQVRVYLRLCSDNKILKLSTLVDMFKMLDDISNQLSKWRASTVRTQR